MKPNDKKPMKCPRSLLMTVDLIWTPRELEIGAYHHTDFLTERHALFDCNTQGQQDQDEQYMQDKRQINAAMTYSPRKMASL